MDNILCVWRGVGGRGWVIIKMAKQIEVPYVKKSNSILFIAHLHYLHLCKLRYQQICNKCLLIGFIK